MRTVQVTLDERLVQTADRVAKQLHTTRSAITREALRQAIARVKTLRLEEKHRKGYVRKPAGADEFGVWEKEQQWGDAGSAAMSAGTGSTSRTRAALSSS